MVATKPRVRDTRRKTAFAVDVPFRTEYLVSQFGGVTALADLLSVAKSQPSRWQRGEELPSPAKARELIDLDHITARARMLWEPEVVQDWLQGPNSYLDGARPIDVLRVRGSTEVLQALDAAASGAFA
jgi:uncharacterized protein (DUF2384 family)